MGILDELSVRVLLFETRVRVGFLSSLGFTGIGLLRKLIKSDSAFFLTRRVGVTDGRVGGMRLTAGDSSGRTERGAGMNSTSTWLCFGADFGCCCWCCRAAFVC